jgi:YihY family inner membrane protein
VALGAGTLTALWAGLGVTQAAQNAMNEIWDVPKKDRPNFLLSRGRGLIMLAVLGTMTLATMFLSGVTTASGQLGVALRIAGLIGSLGINLGLYLIAFRLLTRKKLRWGDVLAGAAVGAVAWTGLQLVGNYYVSHQVKNATSIYGIFGLVIGLLVWLYLGAQVTLYTAEINVVRKYRLWPRSLTEPPLAEADRRTLVREADAEERLEEEDVQATFDPSALRGPSSPAEGPDATPS